MNEKGIKACMSFVLVMKKFLGNYKAENYVEIMVLNKYQADKYPIFIFKILGNQKSSCVFL